MLKKLTFTLIFFVASLNSVHADNMYSGCVLGYDFGTIALDATVLGPANPACQNLCQQLCSAYSRKSQGVELNNPTITDCLISCQDGNLYSGQYYEDTSTTAVPNIVLRQAVQIANACTGPTLQASNNIYQSIFTVNNGDQLILTLGGNTSTPNQIYMCGRKDVKLLPIIASFNTLDWANIVPPQTIWPGPSSNFCLEPTTTSEYGILSNYYLWSINPYTQISANLTPNQSGVNGTCKWSAKNNQPTNTGIYPRNGDELSITYYGDFNNNQIAVQYPPSLNQSRSNYMNCSQNQSLGSTITAACLKAWKDNSRLLITNDYSSTLNGEYDRVIPMGVVPTGAINRPKDFGLSAYIIDNNLIYHVDATIPGCGDPTTNATLAQCVVIDNPGTPTYQYSGVLSGYADYQNLSFMHVPDLNSSWNNNVGGYTIDVSWKGCPFSQGEQIQYTVASSLSAITDSMWVDVPLTNLQNGGPLTINTSTPSGILFFRIAPLTPPSGAAPQVLSNYTDWGNRFGSYYLSIQKVNASGVCSSNGPIKGLVEFVYSTLIGTSTKIGVAESIYNGIVQNTQYINFVRTFLLLYIVFFAIGLLIGVIELNQREAIIRLVKVGIVIALISPNSWQFFATYLLNMFINGGIQLVAFIVASSINLNCADLTTDPFNVFVIFDTPIQQMWSAQVWTKLYAVFLSGVFGLILIALVLFGIIMYCISIARATLIYIFSLIGIAMLLIAAPIFIIFLLFQKTKPLFDDWWKHLLGFSLQPPLVFAGIMIFNLLLMMVLYSMLDFTVCPFCLLQISFTIPGYSYNECWIPGYNFMQSTHLPPTASSGMWAPVNLVWGIICFVILAQSMYKFIGIISNIATRLITGRALATLNSAAGAGMMFGYNTTVGVAKDAVVAGTTVAVGAATGNPDAALRAGATVQRHMNEVDSSFQKATGIEEGGGGSSERERQQQAAAAQTRPPPK